MQHETPMVDRGTGLHRVARSNLLARAVGRTALPRLSVVVDTVLQPPSLYRRAHLLMQLIAQSTYWM